ncbi:hypothetical protein TOPH_02204 [Tolypocladium ophioglossoides CBS 100239]|uniref:Uncharacterized protein n=1 Tax=Tolypocladium ophioglossoides (strain CBS 100239) TaxID=1163406 RepID=A0A0L0NFW7_TOLOC|nr:hypothetical protein TOPH_02204 [Tolypocladium ophioglossoides CBS 100239]
MAHAKNEHHVCRQAKGRRDDAVQTLGAGAGKLGFVGGARSRPRAAAVNIHVPGATKVDAVDHDVIAPLCLRIGTARMYLIRVSASQSSIATAAAAAAAGC